MTNSDDTDGSTKATILNEAARGPAKSYAERGRRYAHFSMEDLSSAFVGAYRRLASNIDDPAAIQVTADVGAEYSLRGAVPPFELIKPEVETMAVTIARRFDEATNDQLELLARSLRSKAT